MMFVTPLRKNSQIVMDHLIKTHVFGINLKSLREQHKVKLRALSAVRKIPEKLRGKFIQKYGFILALGGLSEEDVANMKTQKFIVTETINERLRDLCRIIGSGRNYPILLEGPTSSGKTSLVEYIARLTRHKCVRINNHEHTDIEEYTGSYITCPETGKLRFEEGILAKAVRNGWWVILDELNLAPSEVLEALNRLLDDNRELIIPETQQVIKPHAHFMLFATQNPAGVYGGRKQLSRAFKNRFIELPIDDIPSTELVEILRKRCNVGVFAERMVKCMESLLQVCGHGACSCFTNTF